MTHLRYKATDESWDLDLKLEGFTEEQERYWSLVIQKEMATLLLLYPDLIRVPFKQDD